MVVVFKKTKCSHCFHIGHTVDKCYKVHGYPTGHPRAKKSNKVGNANLAAATNASQNQNDKGFDELSSNMSKEQLRLMIVFFSSIPLTILHALRNQ